VTVRRGHYELAFEAFLDERGTPFVAVEDVRHFVKGRTGVKAFDYIVYPAANQACLVELKGRKSKRSSPGDWRLKTWVTRSDIAGLETWQEIFGGEFRAVFVFAYWHARPRQGGKVAQEGEVAPAFRLAGRDYSFWLVAAADYAAHQKRLSKSWDTVSVSRDVFRSICRPVEASWPRAPC
jgi:hypothetical protein